MCTFSGCVPHIKGIITPLLLWDNYQSSWVKAIHCKLQNLGFSLEVVLKIGYDHAKAMFKQRLFNIEQWDNGVPNFMIPEQLRYIVILALSLSFLQIPSLLTDKVTSSSLLEGDTIISPWRAFVPLGLKRWNQLRWNQLSTSLLLLLPGSSFKYNFPIA